MELSEQIDKYNQLLMSKTGQIYSSEPAVDSGPGGAGTREDITGGSDKKSSGPATDMASGKGVISNNIQQTFSSG